VKEKEKRSPLLVIGGIILVALFLVAALAPLLAPYDPKALSGDSLERPSAHHILGTNDIGQDIFSEMVWGARSSMRIAILGATLAVTLGVVIGVGAGLLGGFVDLVVSRLLDLLLPFPSCP
jgi:peptide/nickel transport system permease protein